MPDLVLFYLWPSFKINEDAFQLLGLDILTSVENTNFRIGDEPAFSATKVELI